MKTDDELNKAVAFNEADAGPRGLAKYMRLADDLGLPDARGKFLEEEVALWGGEKPPCCAIGGANIAAGRATVTARESQAFVSGDIEYWPMLETQRPICPQCPPRSRDMAVRQLVAHLYDVHEWSRTRIAGWLEGLDE